MDRSFDNLRELRSGHRIEKGFTLIEMVIALVILFIAVMGVFAAVTWATRYNRGNSQRSQALSVMQREIEFLRSAKFTPAVLSTTHNAQPTVPACPNLVATPTATPLPDDGSRSLLGTPDNAPRIDYRCGIDGTVYRVTVRIDDDPSTPNTSNPPAPWPRPTPAPSPAPTPLTAYMKQITIVVTPEGAEGRWVTANAIQMTFRRVLSN
jgi:prepilin-type N-terminal cleavage/methylation domain-containing protein